MKTYEPKNYENNQELCDDIRHGESTEFDERGNEIFGYCNGKTYTATRLNGNRARANIYKF